MSYYPYGSVPQQQYAQPGVQANPYGYAAPVAQTNPFASLVMASSLRDAFSGSSSGGTSSSSKVSIVTYDSVYGKGTSQKSVKEGGLGLDADQIDLHGLPLALKFKDCDILIPIPSSASMCATMEGITKGVMPSGASDKQKKDVNSIVSKQLAQDYYDNCGYSSSGLSEKCGPTSGLSDDLAAKLQSKPAFKNRSP